MNLIHCRVWHCFTHWTLQGFCEFESNSIFDWKTSRKTLTSNPLETHIPIAVRPRVGRFNRRGRSTMKILHHVIISCSHLFTIWLRMDSGSWNHGITCNPWCLGNMEGTKNEHENGSTHIYKAFKLKILESLSEYPQNPWSSLLESCMLWDREAKARQDRLLERRRQEALAREDAWMQMRGL